MTIAVSISRTMANARPVVADDGINIAPRHLSGRERLIMLSRRWQAEQKRKADAAEAKVEDAIERAMRQHRKIPRPYVDPDHGTPAKTIIAMVPAWHGVGVGDIMGKGRFANIVVARHDAIAAVYLNCRVDGRRYTLGELGRAFNKDHTSVLNALARRGLK